MALNVWIREEDLPKGKKLVNCADNYFEYAEKFKLDDKVKRIIKLIDKSQFIDIDKVASMNITEIKLETQYGIVIRLDELSTGCKVYLNVYFNNNVLFDTIEAGSNVLIEILKLQQGNILLNSIPPVVADFRVNIDVHYGRKITHFDSYMALCDYCDERMV